MERFAAHTRKTFCFGEGDIKQHFLYFLHQRSSKSSWDNSNITIRENQRLIRQPDGLKSNVVQPVDAHGFPQSENVHFEENAGFHPGIKDVDFSAIMVNYNRVVFYFTPETKLSRELPGSLIEHQVEQQVLTTDNR